MNSIVPSHSDPDNRSLTLTFQGQYPIRTVIDEFGNSWFDGPNTCVALGLTNPSMAYNRLDNDEKQPLSSIDGTPKQNGVDRTYISESGLYSLILLSRKPEAKAFKKWVTSEVLPAIRKTGRYEIQTKPASALDALETIVRSLRAQQDELDTQRTAIAQLHAADEYHTHEIETIKDRLDRADFHTVKAWCDLQRIPYTISLLQKWGRDAAALSREYQIEIVKLETPGAKYPAINVYHKSILLLICVPKQKPTRQLPLLD